jgi:hypothetical protein
MLSRPLLVAALVGLQPLGAAAAVHWLCGLSPEMTRLVCVAESEPAAAAVPAPETTAVVNGTRFPLDAGSSYTVDFWSPPSDMAFVDRLARATLCYRSPGCQVTVTAPELESALAAVAPAGRRRR